MLYLITMHSFVIDLPQLICTFYKHSLVIFAQVNLVLQLSSLKKQQTAIVSADNNALLWDPGMAQVVLWLHLLEIEGLEVALTVAEVAKDSVANHTQLGVVLWVEANLNKKIKYVLLTLWI